MQPKTIAKDIVRRLKRLDANQYLNMVKPAPEKTGHLTALWVVPESAIKSGSMADCSQCHLLGHYMVLV